MGRAVTPATMQGVSIQVYRTLILKSTGSFNPTFHRQPIQAHRGVLLQLRAMGNPARNGRAADLQNLGVAICRRGQQPQLPLLRGFRVFSPQRHPTVAAFLPASARGPQREFGPVSA